MRQTNFFFTSFQVLIRFALSIVFFPLWWYSRGFFRLLKRVSSFLRSEFLALGLSVWVKNIFVPMYGQRDFTGRLISFFIRLVQIIFRSIIWLFWLLLALAVIIAWLALPLALLISIAFQLAA